MVRNFFYWRLNVKKMCIFGNRYMLYQSKSSPHRKIEQKQIIYLSIRYFDCSKFDVNSKTVLIFVLASIAFYFYSFEIYRKSFILLKSIVIFSKTMPRVEKCASPNMFKIHIYNHCDNSRRISPSIKLFQNGFKNALHLKKQRVDSVLSE